MLPLLALLAAFAGTAVQARPAQEVRPTPAGEWRVQFVTPLGQRVVNMTMNEAAGRITGHVTDEFGEYDLSGSYADLEVIARWSVSEEGKPLEITMRGVLEAGGNVINGTARLGDVGEGTLTARRTQNAALRER
jgi:hypothetical protein